MIAVHPQSPVRSSSTSTSTASPGRAPRTATGPVSGQKALKSRLRIADGLVPGRSWRSEASRVATANVSPGAISSTGGRERSHT